MKTVVVASSYVVLDKKIVIFFASIQYSLFVFSYYSLIELTGNEFRAYFYQFTNLKKVSPCFFF